jgi:hypothetical protein
MDLNETSQQFLKDFTEKFVNDIVASVQKDAVELIQDKLKQFDISTLLQEQIDGVVVPFFTDELQKKLENDVAQRLSTVDVVTLINQHLIKVIIPRMENQAKERLGAEILNKLQSLDIAELANQHTTRLVRDSIKTLHFPDQSIPGRAINTDSLAISADNISGGVIKKFESTGIQDSAKKCQVTILDQATVFENRLVARGLEIVGNSNFKGNISIDGEIDSGSSFVKQLVNVVTDNFEQNYQNRTSESLGDQVIGRILDEGIDVSVIKLGDKSLVEDDTLDSSITNSNLQTVGALKELQVVGETLLDETLFVSSSRVGVNTMHPEGVLDLWDQEIQIVAMKKQQDVAFIGTGRNQTLIIGTNHRDQLTVNTDGSISVKSVNIGKTNHTSSNRMPTDNRPAGQIVWNEMPSVGAPIGWVSLGGARWAHFGIVTG